MALLDADKVDSDKDELAACCTKEFVMSVLVHPLDGQTYFLVYDKDPLSE